MTRRMPPIALALLLACGLAAAPAQAQLSRTFVSAAGGNDANNCDRPTPCRTFQGAHDKTNPDGEITVLDPGGYGAVTITKSISIVNDGVGEAGMLVSGGAAGITISAPASAYVNLRGMTVQGIGFGGGNGLTFRSGFALTITNCVFRGHTGGGITFAPNTGGTGNLSVFNTLLSDNGGDAIRIAPAGDVTARIVAGRITLANNSRDGMQIDGSSATGTISVSVTDSVSANNGQSGFLVFSQAGKAMTSLLLSRSTVANNNTGLVVSEAATAILRFGGSNISGNVLPWAIGPNSILQSFGDNYVAGNANDGFVAPTISTK